MSSPSVSSVILQDWYFNKMTTVERLGLSLNIAHKYLIVYDTVLQKRYTWDGYAWVETGIPSGISVSSRIWSFFLS